MKKSILLASLCLLIIGASQAQDFPKLDPSPMDASYFPSRAAFRAFAKNEEGKKPPLIRVTYSRPQKNGRVIFGDNGLQKNGELWRVGANESTEIIFMKDAKIDGKTVKAGRYTLHAMLKEKEWTIYVSSDLDAWGSYSFDPAKSTVAQITVPTQETPSVVENMSIIFEGVDDGAHMIIGWDDRMVRVPIQI